MNYQNNKNNKYLEIYTIRRNKEEEDGEEEEEEEEEKKERKKKKKMYPILNHIICTFKL